jgi:hypothetical protein
MIKKKTIGISHLNNLHQKTKEIIMIIRKCNKNKSKKINSQMMDGNNK